MPADRTINEVAQVFPRKVSDMPAGLSASEAKFYAEDGWVFRERAGKGIECVGRYEDAQVMDLWRAGPERLRG
jgi:hypothetical protein